MLIRKLAVGTFLHSFAEKNLETSIKAAGKSGLGLKVVQLGPVSDDYLGRRGATKRGELVDILKSEEVSVGPLCVCYEHRESERGGQEEYDDIERIAETGGYGYEGRDKERIIAERIQLTKEHISLAKNLKKQGVMSSKRAILTTHVGFFDRPRKRKQIKEAVKEIVDYCKKNYAYLAIETGSEKIENLVEFIKEIEAETGIYGRLGINYDPANFLLYGTQYPLEALNALKGENSKYLFGVHAKDAKLSSATGEITGVAQGVWKGSDVRFGDGSVPWGEIIPILYDELGYRGPLIIEREAQDIERGVMAAVADIPDKLAAEIAKARRGDIKHAMTKLYEFGKYVA